VVKDFRLGVYIHELAAGHGSGSSQRIVGLRGTRCWVRQCGERVHAHIVAKHERGVCHGYRGIAPDYCSQAIGPFRDIGGDGRHVYQAVC
jgi:hypothetical protein